MTRTWAVCAVTTCIILIPAWRVALTDPATIDSGPTSLRFRLDPGKATYALYEPVVVSRVVSNPTDRAIESTMHLVGLGTGISIRQGMGEDKPLRGPLSICTLYTDRTIMKPRSSDGDRLMIFYNYGPSKGLAFPTTGRYVLSGGIQVGNDPKPVVVRGEPVSIEVRKPTGLDQQAINALGSVERMVTLFTDGVKSFCKGETDENCGESLRTFEKSYGDSDYAPAVAYVYAQAVAAGDISIGPEDDSAIPLYRAFLKRWSGHPIAPLVMSALILRLESIGELDEARTWLRQFDQSFPEGAHELLPVRRAVEEARP